MNRRLQGSDQSNRRDFLQAAGLGAAALAAAGLVARDVPASEPAARAPQPPEKKLPLKLGLASYSLRKFPLEKALTMTQRVGLKHICLKSFHLPLDASKDEIATAVVKVKAAGLDLYGCGVVSMNKESEVEQAFEYAKTAGMTTIVASPSPNVLPAVNQKVQQYDIQVAIHNHGPGDKTYPTPKSVYEKIRDLDKRIGLCIDVGHTQRVGDDPIRAAEQYADRLLDMHIKDVTGAEPKAKEIVVGRGVIDIPRLLRTLVQVKFRGIVSFEYENEPDDPLPGLAESVGFVRGALTTL